MKSSATHIRPIFDRPTLAEKLAEMVGRNWEQPSVDEQADLNAESTDGIDWDAYDAEIVNQCVEAGLDLWEEVTYVPTNRERGKGPGSRQYRQLVEDCEDKRNGKHRRGSLGARKHRTLHDRRAMPNAWCS